MKRTILYMILGIIIVGAVAGGVYWRSQQAAPPEQETRSAVVEAEVINESGRVAPGMYCRVAIDLGRRDNALLLPAAALIEVSQTAVRQNGSGRPGNARVWTVNKGRAYQKKVSLGERNNEYYEVLGGLTPDARLRIWGRIPSARAEEAMISSHEIVAGDAGSHRIELRYEDPQLPWRR